MNKIIYINWGGLGDHLQFSTLPEKLTKIGYEVYISSESLYRSHEIYDLVWGKNPYVKGVSSEPPNCGHVPNWGFSDRIVSFDKNNSIHKNIENLYGITDNSNYPKIYYKPIEIEKYKNKIIVDLNAFSITEYDSTKIKEVLKSLIGQKIIVIKSSGYSKKIVEDDFYSELDVDFVSTESIFDYVNIIYSCSKFYCLWSGSSVLSSSIKEHYKEDLEINCFKKTEESEEFGKSDKSFFWYENINYIFI